MKARTAPEAPLGTRLVPNDHPLVTHVVAPAATGGLETVVASLAAGRAARSLPVRVIALLGPDARCEPFAKLGEAGVELEEVRLPPRSYLREIETVRRSLERAAGVVHTHGFHGNLIGWRAAQSLRRPVMATVHGYTGGGLKGRGYDWLDRRILRRFDAVVAVSSPLQQLLTAAGVPAARVTVIRNARPGEGKALSRAAARQALGLPAEGLIVAWVGRLSEEKAPDQFVEAVAQLPDAWSASILGSGPMAEALQRSTVERKLRITWHGAVPAAGTLLRAFDVVALTSRTEGTPMIVLEAMAAGVPVVSTRVGGVPDLLGDEEGYLVPPGRPADIAAAIDRVRLDPAAAATTAARASSKLEQQFDYGRWLDQYERLYHRLLTDR